MPKSKRYDQGQETSEFDEAYVPPGESKIGKGLGTEGPSTAPTKKPGESLPDFIKRRKEWEGKKAAPKPNPSPSPNAQAAQKAIKKATKKAAY